MAFKISSTRATPSELLLLAVDPAASDAASEAAGIESGRDAALEACFGGSSVSPVKIGSLYCTNDSGGEGVDMMVQELQKVFSLATVHFKR